MITDVKWLEDIKNNKKEIVGYIVFGILTTLVNYITYFSLTQATEMNYLIVNMIAWFVSVVFAYITNKYYVFKNKYKSIKYIIKEISLFISARLASGVFETLFLFIFVSIFNFDDGIVKIIASIFVVVLNYFFSKYIIFNVSK